MTVAQGARCHDQPRPFSGIDQLTLDARPCLIEVVLIARFGSRHPTRKVGMRAHQVDVGDNRVKPAINKRAVATKRADDRADRQRPLKAPAVAGLVGRQSGRRDGSLSDTSGEGHGARRDCDILRVVDRQRAGRWGHNRAGIVNGTRHNIVPTGLDDLGADEARCVDCLATAHVLRSPPRCCPNRTSRSGSRLCPRPSRTQRQRLRR